LVITHELMGDPDVGPHDPPSPEGGAQRG